MADIELGTYSPEDVQTVISVRDVIHTVSGYVDGTFINVTRAVPSSILYQGADNSGGRTLRSNKAGTVALTLHQLSSTNDVLSWLHERDQEARDNTWLFSMLIKDNTGRSLYYARQCFISQLPESGFSTEVGERAWEIQSVNLQQLIGGNAVIDPATEQAILALGGTVDTRWSSQ